MQEGPPPRGGGLFYISGAQLEQSFLAAVAVDAAMGTQRNLADIFRNHHAAQGPGKGLLMDMGMQQHPYAQHPAARGEDVPAIHIMLPAFVGVGHGHGKAPGTVGFLRGVDGEPGLAPIQYPAMLKGLKPAAVYVRDIPDETVAYVLFTSGTTTRPKGVEITHRNLLAQMATFVRHYGLSTETNLLNILPLHHTDGLTQGVVLAFVAGGSRWIHISSATSELM